MKKKLSLLIEIKLPELSFTGASPKLTGLLFTYTGYFLDKVLSSKQPLSKL